MKKIKAIITDNGDTTYSVRFGNRLIARFIWGDQSKEQARHFQRVINNGVKNNPYYEPE